LLLLTEKGVEMKLRDVNSNKSRFRRLEREREIDYTFNVGLKNPIIFEDKRNSFTKA